MLRTLIEFEINNWLCKTSTIVLLLLWAAILMFAVSNTASQVQSRQQRADSLTVVEHDRLAKHPILMDSFATGGKVASVYWNDARNAYDIGSHYGKKYMFKPNDAPALAIGQSNLHHSDHEVTTAAEFWFSALRKAERMDNPSNIIYGAFDVAFALVWLLPLIVIVFTYNVLSVEREQGTLKLLLVQGASIRTLLVGRIAFRLLALMGLTLTTIIIGLVVFQPNGSFNGLWYFVVITLCYASLWHLISLCINLLNRSSNYNAGALFMFWIAGVLVLPALLNVVVTTIKPIPGKVTLVDEVREMLTENDQKNAEILDQFYTDHPQFVIKDSAKLMPVFMYKYMIKEMATSEQLQPIMDDYKSRMEAQSNTINVLAAFVPAMAFQEGLEEVSGNSLSQYLAFERFADNASREWRNYFHPISLANKYLSVDEFNQLPKPKFSIPDDNRKNTLLLLSLGIWCGIAVFMGIWLLRGYKVQ